MLGRKRKPGTLSGQRCHRPEGPWQRTRALSQPRGQARGTAKPAGERTMTHVKGTGGAYTHQTRCALRLTGQLRGAGREGRRRKTSSRRRQGGCHPPHPATRGRRQRQKKPEGIGHGTGRQQRTQPARAGNWKETLDSMGAGNMGQCFCIPPQGIWSAPAFDPACPRVPFCHGKVLTY